MYLIFILPVISIVFENVCSEIGETDETSTKVSAGVVPTSSAPESWDGNQINSLWAYTPTSHMADLDEDSIVRRVVLNQPHTLTRLIKTLAYGLNPQIKYEIEHFEKRRKPVTLVGLRKNGFFPRFNVNPITYQSSEVAELQSPYNDVGHFWLEQGKDR